MYAILKEIKLFATILGSPNFLYRSTKQNQGHSLLKRLQYLPKTIKTEKNVWSYLLWN